MRRIYLILLIVGLIFNFSHAIVIAEEDVEEITEYTLDQLLEDIPEDILEETADDKKIRIVTEFSIDDDWYKSRCQDYVKRELENLDDIEIVERFEEYDVWLGITLILVELGGRAPLFVMSTIAVDHTGKYLDFSLLQTCRREYMRGMCANMTMNLDKLILVKFRPSEEIIEEMIED